MERYEDKIAKQKIERDRQQDKVNKLTVEYEKVRSRLNKENAKLQELNDKIDRTEYFLFKTKLKEVGLEGNPESAIDTLITVYAQYVEVAGDDNSPATTF